MQVSPVRVWVLALIIENDIISTINACGRGSVVERLLAKEKATGSNPVARSSSRRQAARPAVLLWRRGQVVKAEVCKTSITGSNPVVASELMNQTMISPKLLRSQELSFLVKSVGKSVQTRLFSRKLKLE